ncbi:ubiquitin fusion degradation 1 [Melia azedarach]|uniref:Ubiquitin fusion degradation 1 n=1 Tax=Melia azedarach TaxID=155640 RepID=A0ACC1X720_MELAZ|nr:ubiquitin fusion degradation 1 [Melia azedarach]
MDNSSSKKVEFYRSFRNHYHCYSFSHVTKPQLESSDKIIRPKSDLDRLAIASTDIEYPCCLSCHPAKFSVTRIRKLSWKQL